MIEMARTMLRDKSKKNGVSEWTNRTLIKMAQRMLMDKGFPKTFWEKAMYTKSVSSQQVSNQSSAKKDSY